MAVNICLEKCIGCGVCVEVCFQEALSIIDGQVSVNPDLCEECGVCVSICEHGTLSLEDE